MENEKLVTWKPMNGIPKTLYLIELKYDSKGLTLSLVEGNNMPVLIIFFDGDLSHRIADEGDLLKMVSEAERDKDARGTLYTVENSHYLKWFHEQSCGTRQKDNLVHYRIQTPNEIVDVLDLGTPKVMWNNLNGR